MNCIKKIAQGDMDALQNLYEMYKIPVYRLVFSMTKNRDLAEDITQDTFLRIQEKAGTYHQNISEASWIYTIARNLTYDMLRKRSREACEEVDTETLPPSQIGNPENGSYAFLDLIKNLSDKDAEVVSLRIVAELSFKEIGKITKSTSQACSKRYIRALAKLREEWNT